ncbi:MAG: hypothetical protein E6G06_04305 [Actinobacteria bacterium]|nr:MAG: hypothetical protein E6G06_04305 [Actinomycetota bacterium]
MPDGDARTLLESRLRELGREIDAHIEDRDLAAAVTQRLTPSASQPSRRPTWQRSLGRRARPRLVVAAVTVVAMLALIAPVRAAVRSFFDIGAVRVHAPGTRRLPAVTAAALELGSRTTLADARARMTVVVPTVPGFEQPDEVWFAGVGGGQVSLVYRARPGLPGAAPRNTGPTNTGTTNSAPTKVGATNVGLLIQEFIGDGQQVVHKHLTTNTRAQLVMIGSDQGVFLSGGEHFLYYDDPTGAQQLLNGRLVGRALIFPRGTQTIRIEGSLPLARMLAIARSLR